jgi:hypothetical protein
MNPLSNKMLAGEITEGMMVSLGIKKWVLEITRK